MKKVFTTGQVAKICKVAPRTVSKWFDSGRLRGYRIPGSQDRRIPREHLLRFLKEHGMPLGDLEAEVYNKILVVGADAPLQAVLRDHLRESDDFRIETAASGFEAGIRAESFHPDCIIIDMALGRIEAGQIAQNLRKSPDHQGTILLALTSDKPGEETFSLGFNDGFKKPFDGALLAERVRRLISQKKAEEPDRGGGALARGNRRPIRNPLPGPYGPGNPPGSRPAGGSRPAVFFSFHPPAPGGGG